MSEQAVKNIIKVEAERDTKGVTTIFIQSDVLEPFLKLKAEDNALRNGRTCCTLKLLNGGNAPDYNNEVIKVYRSGIMSPSYDDNVDQAISGGWLINAVGITEGVTITLPTHITVTSDLLTSMCEKIKSQAANIYKQYIRKTRVVMTVTASELI